MATKAKSTPQEAEAQTAGLAVTQQKQPQGATDGVQQGEVQPAAAAEAAEAADGDPAGAVAQQDPPPQELLMVDVRVLAAVTIDCVRFLPNDVIEGMPDAVAQAYAGSVDAHPDAVAYARSIDSPVKPFPGQAHAED